MVKRIAIVMLVVASVISAHAGTAAAQKRNVPSNRDALQRTDASAALVAHIDALRATRGGIQSNAVWDLDRFEAAITALVEHQQAAVALTWLNKAIAHPAHQKGRGALAAKKRLRTLEKMLGQSFKKSAGDQVRLGLKMAKHASTAASGRNLRIAKVMADATRRHLDVFCNPGARRLLERVEKKLAKAKYLKNGNGRTIRRQGQQADALIAESKEAIKAGLSDYVNGYAIAGDPAGYAAVQAMISETLGEAEADQARTLSWQARNAMITAGYGREVSILVQGLRDLTVEVCGKRVATQRSMCSQHCGKVIKTKVLPGDYLLVRTRGAKHSKRRNMIAVAASVDGQPLDEKDVFTTSADDTGSLWVATITQATTGELTDIDPAEHKYPAKFTKGVEFEAEMDGRLMRLTMAMHPDVLEWFAKHDAKPAFALATKEEPHFAIRIPTVIES